MWKADSSWVPEPWAITRGGEWGLALKGQVWAPGRKIEGEEQCLLMALCLVIG